MNIVERTRPKGFNKKVWAAMYKRAERRKAWAEYTVRCDRKWCAEASQSSLEMLGELLSLRPWKLAEGEYRYLEMRAHGQCSLGAVDPSARRKWECITGRRIGEKTMWKYDHTVHVTSAKRVGRKWVSPYNDKKDVSYKRSA